MYNDEWLAHHGIKGQRWGIRRFQREDGSRTSAGKKRRDLLDRKNSRTTSKEKKKMSDEQLKKRIERLKMEKELKTLEHDTMNSGKAFTEDVMKSIGKKALIQIGTAGLVTAVGIGLTAATAKAQGQSAKGAIKDALDSVKKMVPNAKNQW